MRNLCGVAVYIVFVPRPASTAFGGVTFRSPKMLKNKLTKLLLVACWTPISVSSVISQEKIDKFSLEDIKLKDYESYPSIKAAMAV